MLLIILISFIALEHLYFLYLEMFVWTHARTRQTFGTSEAFARESKPLAANQGLYNGFLAAGLIWGLLYPDPVFSAHIQIFFLICVLIAAVFGGATVKKSILLIQGLPAALAMLLILL